MCPVEDHPIHESTRLKAGTPYGCNNAKRSGHYYAPNRVYDLNGMFHTVLRRIENVMSKECRYDFRATDERCNGCKEKENAR